MEGGRRRRGVTRRGWLMACFSPLRAGTGRKGQTMEPDWRRMLDPATEFEVVRLTDPSYSSFLPAYYGRAASRRSNALVYSCDRSGSLQVWRIDLKSGSTRQLTEVEGLDPASVTLLPDDRGIVFAAGAAVHWTSLPSLRDRQLYRVPAGSERGPGLSVSEDGLHAAFIERSAERWSLRLLSTAKGAATTVVSSDIALSDPQIRPRRAGILYARSDGSWWLVNFDGQQNRRLKLEGVATAAQWAPDGRTVLYLSQPPQGGRVMLREATPDTGADQAVAPTSQFVRFGRNGDASVFVGASNSKASPYVLLLLRVAKRELTLAEHRASDPAMVSPIFSPSSQRIFFQSDREGKTAIYSVNTERLVEKTESE